ncbi:hypothetical protein FKW77_003792 [Venturia effusa]|uniref:Major facilitator superfamily (MFS) profile domain-containing protein n=1 Tax=Venturia effusa TaxID=50376 RepID=A0A517LF88_9PEZI|nr:hypothetical protein FKW77_003792 [Venturia effusa]
MTCFRRAFKLSKNEVKNANPPGTVSLISHHLERTETGRDVPQDEVQLNPRPSLNPADPLNWPLWRKGAILACMSLFAFVANFTSASIASAFPIYATPAVFTPPPSFTQLTRLIAVNVLMLGASNIWWLPLANVFGRRPIMLISLLTLTLCSMWAGLAKSYHSLLAARLFMGIGGGPADVVAPNVVGEVFFVHQRGRAMAIYTVFLTLGPLVGGTGGGYIAASNGVL